MEIDRAYRHICLNSDILLKAADIAIEQRTSKVPPSENLLITNTKHHPIAISALEGFATSMQLALHGAGKRDIHEIAISATRFEILKRNLEDARQWAEPTVIEPRYENETCISQDFLQTATYVC